MPNYGAGAEYGLQGAASGAAIGSIVPGVGTGIGAAAGGALGLGLGLFGRGKRKRYGASEADIAQQATARRSAGVLARQQAMQGGIRRAAGSAQGRGFGASGAMAMGAPDLHNSVMQQQLATEAQIAAESNAMRNARVYNYEPGVADRVMPVLQSAGAIAGAAHGLRKPQYGDAYVRSASERAAGDQYAGMTRVSPRGYGGGY